MGLHAVLEVIRAGARSRVEQLEAQSYAQAGEILANARLEAEGIRDRTCETVAEQGVKERARILHRARLEALQIEGEVRDGLVDSALEQASGRLASLRSTPSYAEVLRRLLVEALDELQISPVDEGKNHASDAGWLEGDPRDRDLLSGLMDEMDLDLPVRYCLNCWGGVNLSSEDGRRVVINTLDARFEKALPYLRRSLAALFEEGLVEQPAARG